LAADDCATVTIRNDGILTLAKSWTVCQLRRIEGVLSAAPLRPSASRPQCETAKGANHVSSATRGGCFD